MGPWAIRSTENLPPPTFTWTPDYINILPKYSAFFQPWCTDPGLFATRKAFMMSWRSSEPLSGKIVIIPKRCDGPSTRRLEPPSWKRSPPRSFFCSMFRRHVVGPAESWPNTIVNVLACRLGGSPVSFVLWRTTWEWGLRGVTVYPRLWSGIHRTERSVDLYRLE
jgi:hypothetical protein